MKRQYRIIKQTNYNEEISYLPQYTIKFLFWNIWCSLSVLERDNYIGNENYIDHIDKYLNTIEEAKSLIYQDIEKQKKEGYYRREIIPYENN